MRYSKITNKLARWIYKYIDRYDCGCRNLQGDPKPFYTTEQLNHGHWLKPLTKTHLQEHVNNQTTHYYTSLRKSPVALLMVDIDAHDGQTDALDAAAWIEHNFFPKAYFERSTNGLGVHLYLLVDIFGNKRIKANWYISDFAKHLALVVKDEGFEANVCGVYGYYSVRTNGVILKGDRAQLAKIPRPGSLGDLERLIMAPGFNLRALKAVVDEVRARGLVQRGDKKKGGAAVSFPTEKEQTLPQVPLSPDRTGEYANYLGTPVPLTPSSSDPWHRKLWAITAYRKHYSIAPDIEQAIDYYEANCTTTGPRDSRRYREIEKAIAAHEKWYDPTHGSASPYAFKADRYLGLVVKHVPAADLYYRKSKTDTDPLTHADVAVFIGICTTIAFSRSVNTDKARASRDRIMKYFRQLKAAGIHPTSCNPNKYQRLLQICEQYELLEIHAPHLPPDRINGNRIAKGYGRLIGPARRHPLYGEFVVRCQQLNLKKQPRAKAVG